MQVYEAYWDKEDVQKGLKEGTLIQVKVLIHWTLKTFVEFNTDLFTTVHVRGKAILRSKPTRFYK